MFRKAMLRIFPHTTHTKRSPSIAEHVEWTPGPRTSIEAHYGYYTTRRYDAMTTRPADDAG